VVSAVRKHQPDLAILDINVRPDHTDDGARAAPVLRDDRPDLGILLLRDEAWHYEAR
jgi:DNA-binding NarL/FixJ family response regulator